LARALGNEYGFNRDELKAFSGIKKDETLDKYAKMIATYMGKMGLSDPTHSYGEPCPLPCFPRSLRQRLKNDVLIVPRSVDRARS
jgi:hypothetical protein